MSTVAGQGKESLMDTELMLFKPLWLILLPGLHGGEYIMFLEGSHYVHTYYSLN